MWEEKSRHDWAQTSGLMALHHNANPMGSQSAKQPADFNPWAQLDRQRARSKAADGTIDRLVSLWVDHPGD